MTANVTVDDVKIGYVWLADGWFTPYKPLRLALANNAVSPDFIKEMDNAVALFISTERLTS